MNDAVEMFVEKQYEFLSFLKSRINMFHESNLFFRDLHYGVMAFLQMNRLRNQYSYAEELTKKIITAYESKGIFVRVDDRSWMLNYVPFKKPTVKVAAPVKSATPVKTAVSTAQAVPKITQENMSLSPAEAHGAITG